MEVPALIQLRSRDEETGWQRQAAIHERDLRAANAERRRAIAAAHAGRTHPAGRTQLDHQRAARKFRRDPHPHRASFCLRGRGTRPYRRLLRRSGDQGKTLATRYGIPPVRVVAQFRKRSIHPQMGVPVHQVKEFAPRFWSPAVPSSTPPYLALALLGPSRTGARGKSRMAARLAAILCDDHRGRGAAQRMRGLPGCHDPARALQPDAAGHARPGRSIAKYPARRCLKAERPHLYPAVTRSTALLSRDDLGAFAECVARRNGQL